MDPDAFCIVMLEKILGVRRHRGRDDGASACNIRHENDQDNTLTEWKSIKEKVGSG